MKSTAKAPVVTLDPKKVAALQAKVARFVGTGALAAAPHSYHH
ncbi:hypothetical protein ACFYWO_38150 [Streptomyces sp. NPDC002932]